MKFTVELHRNGTLYAKFEVPAVRGHTSGAWHGDWPYLPDDDATEAALPYHVRKAFNRARVWWARLHSDTVRCDLRDAKGFPMGSIFATLNA